jgi:asparagine synthase (glutamine-hydrolysing)
MAIRFLALISQEGEGPELRDRILARLAAMPGPMRVSDYGRLVVAFSGSPAIEVEHGVILGALFDRRYPARVDQLPDEEQRKIEGTRGRHLIDTYWGGYVALLAGEGDSIDVVRAPFGELPCYRMTLGDATVVSSDVGLMIEAGVLRPSLCWEAVARELAWRDLRTAETCLDGVRALQGGERLRADAVGIHVDRLWSPWDFAACSTALAEGEAEEMVGRSVRACVAARSSQFEHVLLMLSGGLDSSIVAACLAGQKRPLSLLTLVTRDAVGDERDYGRLMARAVGLPLHEALRDVARIDAARSPSARLPRPAGRMFEQESARLAREAAVSEGTDAIFTGGGGDNVFCALQSASPAADRLLTGGPGRAFLATATEISRLAPASLLAVIRAAVGRTWSWRRSSPTVPDRLFLSGTARAAAGSAAPHAWLVAPRGALPGKAAHIKLLAYADSFLQGTDPQADLPTVAPLLGQPLVETCLRVPSWCWFEDGRNRAVARRAFASVLPDEIAARRSKGSPDGFLGEICERHGAALREMLLDGLLARQGIIDDAAVERALDAAGPMAPVDFGRLLRLADVEAWARGWASRSAG